MKALHLLSYAAMIIIAGGVFFTFLVRQPREDRFKLGMTLEDAQVRAGKPISLSPTSFLPPPGVTMTELESQVAFYSDDQQEVTTETHESFVVLGFNANKILIEIRSIDIQRARPATGKK